MTFEEAIKYPLGDIARGFKLLRDAIKAEDAAHAERMKDSRAQLTIYENAMQKKLQEEGVNSSRTDYGTPYISVVETVKVTDWDAFHAFVEETQEPDFLIRGANKTKVQEWRDLHKALPPGVTIIQATNLNFKS